MNFGDCEKTMTDKIRVGTMLIADGTRMPESLGVDIEPYSGGWSSITNFSSGQLGKEIESAGWTFFYMAGEIHTSGFGFNDQSRTDHAVSQVIDAVRQEQCNCLEITQMIRRSFLGLPCTSLVAHARHIQRSRRFQTASKKMPASVRSLPREWLYDRTPQAQDQPLFTAKGIEAWENEGGSRIKPIRST
jgi:hypothetical protein